MKAKPPKAFLKPKRKYLIALLILAPFFVWYMFCGFVI
nr:MAG TPA: hypothetical protein [Caudoviricetes sp.]DAM37969.1 MAG TPA: hypothetical protein [Caudoviricetes sp.]